MFRWSSDAEADPGELSRNERQWRLKLPLQTEMPCASIVIRSASWISFGLVLGIDAVGFTNEIDGSLLGFLIQPTDVFTEYSE